MAGEFWAADWKVPIIEPALKITKLLVESSPHLTLVLFKVLEPGGDTRQVLGVKLRYSLDS